MTHLAFESELCPLDGRRRPDVPTLYDSVEVDVYQCPDCELRFRFASELEEHITLEHPEFRAESKSLEDLLLAASRRHRHKRSRPESSH